MPVSFTNKNNQHDITEILLKVASNTIKQTTAFGWELPEAALTAEVCCAHAKPAMTSHCCALFLL
jgi:hypothetical protein